LGGAEPDDASRGSTATHMTSECVVLLATDIRNCRAMTEASPSEKFSRFLKDWFRESTRIIESHEGAIDDPALSPSFNQINTSI